MRPGAAILSPGLAAGVAQLPPSGTGADPLETVLRRAGDYVAACERDLTDTTIEAP